jgi:hypothetical protein
MYALVQFAMSPITTEEAILCLEYLDHDFYVYKNSANNKISGDLLAWVMIMYPRLGVKIWFYYISPYVFMFVITVL